jgi:hypothetical protein
VDIPQGGALCVAYVDFFQLARLDGFGNLLRTARTKIIVRNGQLGHITVGQSRDNRRYSFNRVCATLSTIVKLVPDAAQAVVR